MNTFGKWVNASQGIKNIGLQRVLQSRRESGTEERFLEA